MFQQGNLTIWRVRYLFMIGLGDWIFIYDWVVLTQNRTNTLEYARMRRRSSKRSEPAMPWQTGLTGSADRSDQCGAENREDLETRARKGPRRSLRG